MRFWQHIKEMDGLLEEDSEAIFETEDSVKSPTDLKWLVNTLILCLILSNIAWVIATRSESSKPVTEPPTDITLTCPPDNWQDLDVNHRVDFTNALCAKETVALEVNPITVHCITEKLGVDPVQYVRDSHQIVVDTAWLSTATLPETVFEICREVYIAYCYSIEKNTCYVDPTNIERNARRLTRLAFSICSAVGYVIASSLICNMPDSYAYI